MPYCRNLFFNDFDQLRADSCVLKITVNSLRTFGMIGLFLAGLLFVPSLGAANELSPVEQLGKQLFFDTNLSTPAGQSCASCHAPEAGFSGPNSQVNLRTGVYPGAAAGRFGNRKPPTVAYASFSPKRTFQDDNETWVGGQFWDGRADDLIAQAKGPLLNPLEMNNASAEEVVNKVRKGGYQRLFEQVFGPRIFVSNSFLIWKLFFFSLIMETKI